MRHVWPALGTALILVGLVDVFLAVLQHDAVGFLTPVLYRWTWVSARVLTRPLPRRAGSLVRAVVAPAMVVLTLATWLGTQLLGYALVYWPGVQADGFVLSGHLRKSFGVALYFSAATLCSLTFSDLAPATMRYHALAATETMVGLAILTLTISYILNVYRVLQQQNALAAALHHQAADGGNPRTILVPHFVDGGAVGLSTHLREFHRSLVEQAEGLRRYPIVYYFQSRTPYRSIPYIFHMIGGVVAALRFGLPAGHAATTDPWLPALTTGYTDVMAEMEDTFVDVGRLAVEPASFETFVAAMEGAATGDEARVRDFLDLDRFMRGLVRLDRSADPRDAYGRYCLWLPFATESEQFVAAMAADLGNDLDTLLAEPEQARF
jgi:hypothetical protein